MFPSITPVITWMPLRVIWAALAALCLVGSADWSTGARSCLWTQCPAHSCVVPKIATTKGCPLPSPQGYNVQRSSDRTTEWLRLEVTSGTPGPTPWSVLLKRHSIWFSAYKSPLFSLSGKGCFDLYQLRSWHPVCVGECLPSLPKPVAVSQSDLYSAAA